MVAMKENEDTKSIHTVLLFGLPLKYNKTYAVYYNKQTATNLLYDPYYRRTWVRWYQTHEKQHG